MPIIWPSSLIREMAERRCIIFLGAGISASASAEDGSRPKTWHEFLSAATSIITDPLTKDTVEQLVKQKRFLLALQAIQQKANPADYHDLLNENFLEPKFKPSLLHDVIFRLDSRIVITTNFDKIYENYCLRQSDEGYKVLSYDSSSIGDDIRSDKRLIIKAHGSIDDHQSMIFTRSQYHKMKREYNNFYAILQALLLTSTCVFIGCGMEDPDILLTLEDVKIAGSHSRPHYAIVRETEVNQIVRDDWRDTYNIQCLSYGPNHSDLVSDLEDLFQVVYERRKILIG